MIQTAEALKTLIQSASQQEAVALDTEFVWERTYHARLGLVQLGWTTEEVHLLDVLALEDLTPLKELLENPAVTKILHDAPQDLMILQRATGASPKTIFDTRVAAGFAGQDSTISLSRLLMEELEVHLPKTETRTNWLKRPLSDKQQEYALDDVRYLPTLQEMLQTRSRDNGHEDKLAEDLAGLEQANALQEADPLLQYKRVKGAGKLKPEALNVLQALAAWRECEARKRDKPRGHIVHDRVLLDLACKQPTDEQSLYRSSLSDKALRRYAEPICGAINMALHQDRSQWPTSLRRKPLPKALREQADALLGAIAEKAQQQHLDPALIGSRAHATAFVEGTPSPLQTGWRAAFIQDLLPS